MPSTKPLKGLGWDDDFRETEFYESLDKVLKPDFEIHMTDCEDDFVRMLAANNWGFFVVDLYQKVWNQQEQASEQDFVAYRLLASIRNETKKDFHETYVLFTSQQPESAKLEALWSRDPNTGFVWKDPRGAHLNARELIRTGVKRPKCIWGAPTEDDKWPDVFVAMPFSDEFTHVYDEHIKPLFEQGSRRGSRRSPDASRLRVGKFRSCRIDQFRSPDPFGKEIWDGICSAQVVVAVCSDGNPNVYYEIGLAHAVGKPVILLTTSGVASDLRHIRYITYDDKRPSKTQDDIAQAIAELAEQGRVTL